MAHGTRCGIVFAFNFLVAWVFLVCFGGTRSFASLSIPLLPVRCLRGFTASRGEHQHNSHCTNIQCGRDQDQEASGSGLYKENDVDDESWPSQLPSPKRVQAGQAPVVAKVLEDLDYWALDGDLDAAEASFKTLCSIAPAQFRKPALLLLLRACIKGTHYQRSAVWIRRAETLGIKLSIHAFDGLLAHDGLRRGSLRGTLLRVQESGVLDLQLENCNMVISMLAAEGHVAAAEHWLDKIWEIGWEPDVVSYSSVMHACAVRREVDAAERIMTRMENAGVKPNLITINTLIDACAKAVNSQKAELWLQRVSDFGLQPSIRTFNSAIAACAKSGDLPRAQRIMDEMRAAGVKPDIQTFNSMIHACSTNCDAYAAETWLSTIAAAGLHPNMYSYNSVISAFAKLGDVESSKMWLEAMPRNKIDPDVVSYTSVINACAVKGDPFGAEYWLVEMIRHNIQPSTASYRAVMKACARGKASARASYWLSQLIQVRVDPGVQAYNIVLNAKGRSGQMEKAEEWFRLLIDRRNKPDKFSFDAMMNGYSRQGDLQRAQRWFTKMQEAGIQPDLVSYSHLLNACAKAEPPNSFQAEKTFMDLVAASIHPDKVAFEILSLAVGHERAQELCGRFTAKGKKATAKDLRDVHQLRQSQRQNDFIKQRSP